MRSELHKIIDQALEQAADDQLNLASEAARKSIIDTIDRQMGLQNIVIKIDRFGNTHCSNSRCECHKQG